MKDEKAKKKISGKLSINKKNIILILIIIIILSSIGLFFFLQTTTEENIKKSIFNKFRDNKIESTTIVADHIASDLQSVMLILQGIVDLVSVQSPGAFEEKFNKILNEKLSSINKITEVNGIYFLNNKNIIKYEMLSQLNQSLIGTDLSNKNYIKQMNQSLKPSFSNGFIGTDDIYRIALIVPILSNDSSRYAGAVQVTISTEKFFEHYGNIHDVNSQFLVVYDKKGNLLAVGADKSLLGENFFNEKVQNFTNHNPILMNNTVKLLQGISGYAIYDYGRGERLTTTYPVLIEGKPEYFVQIVNPTLSLYSEINKVIIGEEVKTFFLLLGTIAAVASLIVILVKWNIILNKEVKTRTSELEESNKLLKGTNEELLQANEALKIHDRMQKEFINIASHEIKTPVQSILGFSQLLGMYPEKQTEFIDSLQRNAYRLQRLSNDLLEVTKIESKAFKLKKEVFTLNDTILKVVKEQNTILENSREREVKLILHKPNEPIIVEADNERIGAVVSNLISNAIKFTEVGEIIINVKKENSQYVLVSVRDTGSGIDQRISAKLFSKFTTTSFQGIGLGLYISKNIIKAHGGRIWGENNKDSRGGATFYFRLPLFVED